MIDYSAYEVIPPLQRQEINYLRRSLNWSQTKFGQFMARNTATISRWESGELVPDAASNAVLYRLWLRVFGEYRGPYPEHSLVEKEVHPSTKPDVLKDLGKALLIGGIAFFIVRGFAAIDEGEGRDE